MKTNIKGHYWIITIIPLYDNQLLPGSYHPVQSSYERWTLQLNLHLFLVLKHVDKLLLQSYQAGRIEPVISWYIHSISLLLTPILGTVHGTGIQLCKLIQRKRKILASQSERRTLHVYDDMLQLYHSRSRISLLLHKSGEKQLASQLVMVCIHATKVKRILGNRTLNKLCDIATQNHDNENRTTILKNQEPNHQTVMEVHVLYLQLLLQLATCCIVEKFGGVKVLQKLTLF